MQRIVPISLFIILALFVIGFAIGSRGSVDRPVQPIYGSGNHEKDFYDQAYERGEGEPVKAVTSAVVAHHLLIADKMAELFEDIGNEKTKTVIVVGPNHFSVGVSPAQITFGNYETVYGVVENNVDGDEKLLAASSILKHEEKAFSNEHSIYTLTPFIKRSFPNAKIIPIIVHNKLSAADAWKLGSTIAKTFPDAVLIASVDMTHYHDQAFTDQNDAVILDRIEHGWKCNGLPCTDDVEIDSNASMRILSAFNEARQSTAWHLTDHDSSMLIGATTNPADNTSHILGYFTKE